MLLASHFFFLIWQYTYIVFKNGLTPGVWHWDPPPPPPLFGFVLCMVASEQNLTNMADGS